MNDIVERLLIRRNPMLDGEREEAAAEIERLRERVTTQEELLEFKRVEITKLRGLLNEFWECADADTEYWDLQGGYHKELRQRVRKALGE